MGKKSKRVIEICLICAFSVLILLCTVRSGVIRQVNLKPASASEPEQTIQPAQTASPAAINTPTAAVNQLRWPVPTFSPVMVESGNLGVTPGPKKNKQKKYLLQNSIIVIEKVLKGTVNDCKYELRYPQIDGLLDLSVQSTINNTFKAYMESFLEEASLYPKDLKDIRMGYNVSANYNNILCITTFQNVMLSDTHYLRHETFLYELVNGKRLEMKDVFAANTEFPGVLNRAIVQYLLKNNLEETIMKSAFKGIRVGQDFELTENAIRILLDKNDEINTTMLVYGPDNITFKFSQFNGLADIYEKYSNSGKGLYQTPAVKRKMIPNDFEGRYMQTQYNRDTYRAVLHGRMFSGMKNTDFQKKLNDICSDTGESEFKKLLPANLKKVTNDYSNTPYITRSYDIIANYSDLICLECYEHYTIPDVVTRDTLWHMSYNVLTGKKLELKDLFKSGFDWKNTLISKIKSDAGSKNLKLDIDLNTAISKADFWFNEDSIYVNLKPEEYVRTDKNNLNVFSFPFESIGEDNFTIRE